MTQVNVNSHKLLKPQLRTRSDWGGFLATNFPVIKVHKTSTPPDGVILVSMKWRFPSHVNLVSGLPNLSLPDAEKIIADNTRYFAYHQFLPAEESARLKEHHHGHGFPFIASAVGITGSRAQFRMNICVGCMAEDIENELAPPTWKRSHLLEGALACPWHELPLLTFCPSCWADRKQEAGGIPQTMWEPSVSCVCTESRQTPIPMSDQNLEVAIQLARMTEQVFGRTIPESITAWNVRKAVRKLMTPAEGMRGLGANIDEAINSTFSPEMRQHLGLGGRCLRRFVATNNTQLNTSPIQNIAIIFALFRGFDGLIDALDGKPVERPIFQPVSKVAQKWRRPPLYLKQEFIDYFAEMTLVELDVQIRLARKWLLELKRENPKLQRSELYLRFRVKTHYQILQIHDNEWLSKQMRRPQLVRVKKRIDKRDNIDLHSSPDVRKFKGYLRDVKTEYLMNNPFRKVTANSLRGDISCGSFHRLIKIHSHLKTAMASYIDTDAQWRRRVTHLLCRIVKHYDPGHPMADKQYFSSLTDDSFNYRTQEARAWIRKRGNALVTPADFQVHLTKRKNAV